MINFCEQTITTTLNPWDEHIKLSIEFICLRSSKVIEKSQLAMLTTALSELMFQVQLERDKS